MSARRDITIEKGFSYSHSVTFQSDQSESTFAASLSDGTDFTVTVESGSEITLELTDSQTALLVGPLHWTLSRTTGSFVDCILRGSVHVV